jgi:hypothetical protein
MLEHDLILYLSVFKNPWARGREPFFFAHS